MSSQLLLEMGAETAPNRSERCPVCGLMYEPYSRRKAVQKTCGASSCRSALWRKTCARTRGKRQTKGERMLARLEDGPAKTWELMQIGGSGWRSRLQELREGQVDGVAHQIRTESHGDYAVYTLVGSLP